MSQEKIVRRVEEISEAVGAMNEAMKSTPEKVSESQLKITKFKKKFPDALYIEAAVKIPTGGIKHPEMEKQREYLWEYVVGVFESQMIQGKLEFYRTGLPGDDYCKWVIPVNKPVGVPRFIAQHLQKGLGWKEMVPLGRENEPQSFYDEEINKPFEKFVYKKRGNFHPMNSY